jgi:hypothetical protein
MGIMKRIFGKCSNCGVLRIGGAHEGDEFFCSRKCHEWWCFPSFCNRCVSETTNESIGSTRTFNFIGTHLWQLGYPKHVCPVCKSRVLRAWFVFFLPLYPISGKYRVKFTCPNQYISRKLRLQ